MIASIAYALHVNRDLASPNGRNYGAHADFWADYLVNDFEAKWREREGVTIGFPIMMNAHTATAYGWTKWHLYMGLLTGEQGYTDEAHRLADILWGETEIRPVDTPTGIAYVWPRSVLSLGGSGDYLMPITYASPVFSQAVEFHQQGFHRWDSTTEMERFARTITTFLMDTNDPIENGFASDVGGSQDRAGLDSDPYWSRMSSNNFRHRSFPQVSTWDTSGDLIAISEALYTSGRIQPAVGAFMNAWTDDRDLSNVLATRH